jgi:LytS/YehU family sensor histidine kinase
MLLQPLVENAVTHGLEPKLEGGEVHISARLDALGLRITIADTGLGAPVAPLEGVGLSNVKQRLMSLFGEAARLEIGRNEPEGTRVELIIPAAAFQTATEQA